MNIIVVYDDTGKKSEVIADIIGERGFADVVVKKRKLEDYYAENIRKIYPQLIWKKVHSPYEYAQIEKELQNYTEDDTRVIHCFSNYIFSDFEKASLSFRKIEYIKTPYKAVSGKKIAAAMFPDMDSYHTFCKSVTGGAKAWDIARELGDSFAMEGLTDVSIVGNFIQCVAGNFESRYFNSLKGDDYTLVKTSSDKRKIKAEYTFYQLLPDDMKFWFVAPFHYQETENSASYTMERLHMTDLSVKWVHGFMDEEEFEQLLDKYFFFFNSRHSRACTEEEYASIADDLYANKICKRVEMLKKLPEYRKIERMLEMTEGADIDTLVEKYFALKARIETRVKYPHVSVIGHGDPCFSNTIYNKSTQTLKFIDPKGALTEEELWTNPYYDIAKLSHSVCGRYDFLNNELFEIYVDKNLNYKLEIPFEQSRYVAIFRRKVEERGYDYLSVRIYEASLFLSMLPLHIDSPYKVVGFILNAKNILEEIEKDV